VRPDPDGELPVIGEVFRRKVAAALRAYRHQIAEDLGERWLEHLKKADRERPAAPPDILDLETIADSAISKAALSVWEVCFDPDEVGEPPDMGAARQRDRDQLPWLAEDSVGLAATLGGRAVREATDPTEVSALLALVAWLDDPTLPADTGRLFLSQEDVSRVVWVVNQMFPSFGLGRDDRTGDKAVRAARRDLSAARPVSSAEDLLRTLAEDWDESVRWRLHWWSNKVMPLGRLLLYALGGLGPSGCWTDKRVRHEAASALCRQFDNCNAGQEWKILEFASRYIECRGPLTAGVVRSKYEAAIAVELAVEPMDKRSDAALALRVLGFHNDPLGGLHSIESRAAQVMGQEYPHCISRPDCGSHTRPPGGGLVTMRRLAGGVWSTEDN
jgi:hypothetical protein